MTLTEALGFATGAACVLLAVRQSVWNFPVGIANNVLFGVLFWRARLFGDMGLQLVYLALGLSGWWLWTRGGRDGGPLAVSTAPRAERAGLAAVALGSAVVLTLWLRRIGDAAPALDALTTVASLAAQWLLNRKRIENWLVWIAADVLYVWLYVSRALFLTAALHAIFLVLCVAGLRRWQAALRAGEAAGVRHRTRGAA